MAESLEDLQIRAKEEYGIVNADSMDEEQLKAEIKLIDDQPSSVDKESADVDEEQDSEKVFTARDTREVLEAEFERLEIDGDPTDREAYPNKQSLVDAIYE